MMNEHERSRLAHLYSRIKDSNSALLEIDSIFDLEGLLESAGRDKHEHIKLIQMFLLDKRNTGILMPSEDPQIKQIDNTIKAIEDRILFLRQRHFLQQIEQNEKIKEIESREAQQSVTQVISDGEEVKRPTQAEIAKFYRVLEYFDFKEDADALYDMHEIRAKRHGLKSAKKQGTFYSNTKLTKGPLNELEELGEVGQILYDELRQSQRGDHIPEEITSYYIDG
jgi:hypothetical protein